MDALLKSGHAVKRNLENATQVNESLIKVQSLIRIFQGIEINVSYRDLSERIRENLDNINPSEWRPQFGMPVSPAKYSIFSLEVCAKVLCFDFLRLEFLNVSAQARIYGKSFSVRKLYGCYKSKNLDNFKVYLLILVYSY